MKKINYIIITMLIAFVISLTGTVKACSPGSVTPYGSYVVYDQGADNTNTYRVYVYVSDECPSQSSPYLMTTLSSS